MTKFSPVQSENIIIMAMISRFFLNNFKYASGTKCNSESSSY